MKSVINKLIAGSLLLMFSSIALAHSGGTNSEGCHTKKSTGEYHCHNKK